MLKELQIIYDTIKPFIQNKGIDLSFEKFVKEKYVFIHNITIENETYTSFSFHIKLAEEGIYDYLNSNFGFKSKVVSLIEKYNDVFNHQHEKVYGHSYNNFIDLNGCIQEMQVISLMDLDYGGDNYDIVEVKDKVIDLNDESVKQVIFDYYKSYFMDGNIEQEYHKMIDELTDEEINIIKMILI